MLRHIVTIAVLASAGSAAAQDDIHMGAFNDAGSIISDIAGNAAVGKSIENELRRRQDEAPKVAAASRAPSDIGQLLSFRRDPRITEQVRAAIASDIRRGNPEAAEHFLKVSRRFDIQGALAREGLTPGSLVDVATYMVGVYWAAAHGTTRVPTGKPLRALRKQMAAALLRDQPERLRGVSDERKQRYADEMLIRAQMMASILADYARTPNPAEQAQIAKGAREQVRKTIGLDLLQYRLTEEGLVR